MMESFGEGFGEGFGEYKVWSDTDVDAVQCAGTNCIVVLGLRAYFGANVHSFQLKTA
jgi:hypothetical protein